MKHLGGTVVNRVFATSESSFISVEPFAFA